MNRLDRLLEKLAQNSPEPPLDRLEADVWRRIEAVRLGRFDARLASAVQMAAAAIALFAGAIAGSMQATSLLRVTDEMSVFSANADLAPSTLLERRG